MGQGLQLRIARPHFKGDIQVMNQRRLGSSQCGQRVFQDEGTATGPDVGTCLVCSISGKEATRVSRRESSKRQCQRGKGPDWGLVE